MGLVGSAICGGAICAMESHVGNQLVDAAILCIRQSKFSIQPDNGANAEHVRVGWFCYIAEVVDKGR